MKIYQPAEDSYFLQQFVREYALGRVLDMGTGSGIQALTAAKKREVREVVAVDIEDDVVKELQETISQDKLKKIKVKQSNLFSNVKGVFDLIIFNPPYLPQDKGVEDNAIYGGKQGWELSAKFFTEVVPYLSKKGKILFLFSSFTNKEKIDEILANHMLGYKCLGTEKLHFEELYVYLIERSLLLEELTKKGIHEITYFTQGKRGKIFTGMLDQTTKIKSHLAKKEHIKVGIKVAREDSEAVGRIENEAHWLKILNKQGIGPRLLFAGQGYIVYRFVEGEHILDWMIKANRKDILTVLKTMLQQCYQMDMMQVTKEEMHHPHKHIVVGKDNFPVLLDFERCTKTNKPKNVTQFLEFLCRIDRELAKKKINLDCGQLRDLAKNYKKNYNSLLFDQMLRCLQ